MELIEHNNINKKSKSGEFKDKGIHTLAVKNVINDILNGGTYSVLMNKLMEDYYEIGHKYSSAQSIRLIREARELIKKDTEEQLPYLKEDMIARFLDIYTECREIGDRMNAIKALEHINKLCGLYQDKLKVDADIKQEIVIDFGYDKDESENKGD